MDSATGTLLSHVRKPTDTASSQVFQFETATPNRNINEGIGKLTSIGSENLATDLKQPPWSLRAIAKLCCSRTGH